MACGLSFGQSNDFKVTLDAGHGGHDDGAHYDGHIEKNITLAIVLKVGKLLEATPNFDVIYTRKTDVFIDLIERAEIANRSDANIFVSIHCNANVKREAFGTETYVMGMTKIASNLAAAKKENSVITLEKDYKQKYEGFDPNSPETMIGMTLMQEEYLENSISLASKIQRSFGALGKKIRGAEDGDGVKQAPYMVLHKAYMPRVLIETGFVSNVIEGAILDSEEGQNEIAQGIADAIKSYKKEYFENVGNESFEEKPIKNVPIPIQPKVNSDTVIINKPIKETPKPIQPKVNSDTVLNKKTIKDTTSSEKPKIILDSSSMKTLEAPISSGIIYKVQLSTSSKKIELIPKNFKGLTDITLEQDIKTYKYFYGQTSDYNVAKNQLNKAKSKGYNSAYLIAIKDGKKISIKEALK